MCIGEGFLRSIAFSSSLKVSLVLFLGVKIWLLVLRLEDDIVCSVLSKRCEEPNSGFERPLLDMVSSRSESLGNPMVSLFLRKANLLEAL